MGRPTLSRLLNPPKKSPPSPLPSSPGLHFLPTPSVSDFKGLGSSQIQSEERGKEEKEWRGRGGKEDVDGVGIGIADGEDAFLHFSSLKRSLTSSMFHLTTSSADTLKRQRLDPHQPIQPFLPVSSQSPPPSPSGSPSGSPSPSPSGSPSLSPSFSPSRLQIMVSSKLLPLVPTTSSVISTSSTSSSSLQPSRGGRLLPSRISTRTLRRREDESSIQKIPSNNLPPSTLQKGSRKSKRQPRAHSSIPDLIKSNFAPGLSLPHLSSTVNSTISRTRNGREKTSIQSSNVGWDALHRRLESSPPCLTLLQSSSPSYDPSNLDMDQSVRKENLNQGNLDHFPSNWRLRNVHSSLTHQEMEFFHDKKQGLEAAENGKIRYPWQFVF